MFISRLLKIHKCKECKGNLIDHNFERCGIFWLGRANRKWDAFFDYTCPRCGHKGEYRVPPDGTDLPGDMFIQFGHEMNRDYVEKQSCRGDIDDIIGDIQ